MLFPTRVWMALFILLLCPTACIVSPAAETPLPAATNIVLATAGARDTESPTAALPTATLTSTPTSTEVPIQTPDFTVTPSLTPTFSVTAAPTPDLPLPEIIIELPGIELPPGFSIIKFAQVNRPTSLAFDAQGRLFVTVTDGTVRIFTDSDEDGRADQETQFAHGFATPLGIAFHPQTGDAYISSTGRLTIARDIDGDGVADEYERFVADLPTGLHQNNTPRFGPDGWLYMGVGSTCDACEEVDERSATIMRFDPQTAAQEIIASGLRNPYDVAFHPESGALFATSNGRDDLGPDQPPEELNHIMMGHDYGWPDCWGNLEGPDCTGTTAAVAFFRAHSSANSLTFYTAAQFPAAYQNDLFVTIWGTWLISGVQAGIQQVELTPEGETYTAETTWFAKVPDGVMPLGLALGPDGALYWGDYIGAAIYRVSYGLP